MFANRGVNVVMLPLLVTIRDGFHAIHVSVTLYLSNVTRPICPLGYVMFSRHVVSVAKCTTHTGSTFVGKCTARGVKIIVQRITCAT